MNTSHELVMRSVASLVSSNFFEDEEERLPSDDEEDELIFSLLECAFQSPTPRETMKGFTSYLHTCSDDTFSSHLRLHRDDVLQELLPHYTLFHSKRPGRTISAVEHLYLYLWFVSHEACSFRDMQNRFDLSLAEISHIIRNVGSFLCSIAPRWIVWPSPDAMEDTARRVRCHKKMEGVVGFIDGTHVAIDKPVKHGEDYFNRKKTYSLHTQVVCNASLEFIDVFVGYPGSVHDSRVFRCSDLPAKLAMLPEDKHLLGDSGYPCTSKLITPFRDNGHLTNKERNFNYALSSARIAVEHSIGLLKQRFRCLYHLKLRDVKTMVRVIKSCVVLHNICMRKDRHLDYDFEPEGEEEEPTVLPNAKDSSDTEEGSLKRRRLCNELCRK